MAARMTESTIRKALVVKDATGASWEKRGNTAWVACPACNTWFPVSPVMLRSDAVPACCPSCHHQFKVAAATPRQS